MLILAAIALIAGACGVSRNGAGSGDVLATVDFGSGDDGDSIEISEGCLLYTSPSPRDATLSRMPSSA